MERGQEEQDPEEARQHRGPPGQEQPGGQDWSIQGRSSAGLERPGPQKEVEAAAARNDKDNKNKSTDAKEWSNQGGREHSPQTGSSVGEPSATDWSIQGNGAPRTGASVGVKRQAGKKHGNRTGTSGEEAHPD